MVVAKNKIHSDNHELVNRIYTRYYSVIIIKVLVLNPHLFPYIFIIRQICKQCNAANSMCSCLKHIMYVIIPVVEHVHL